MPERFYAIDYQNRDVMAVTCEQFGVALDIDLFEFVQLGAVGFRHLFLHHFTKVTTGFAVENDLNSHVHCYRFRWFCKTADEASALPAPQYSLANSVKIEV